MSINENGKSAVNSTDPSGEYLGMQLRIDSADHENLAYFRYCGDHDFHLQFCTSCKLFRYPPTTACPTLAPGTRPEGIQTGGCR